METRVTRLVGRKAGNMVEGDWIRRNIYKYRSRLSRKNFFTCRTYTVSSLKLD